MTWTATDLASLDSAIASGARRVKYSDREVEYRSMNEMLRVRSMISSELASASSTQSNGGHCFEQFSTSKGL